MEQAFAEALKALRETGGPANVWMIGPNAMFLGTVIVIGAILIAVILSRSGAKLQMGKAAIELGQATNLRLEDILALVKKIELAVLRLNLISEENPLEERVIAGEAYIKAGGNGPAKVLYGQLQRRLANKYPEGGGGADAVELE